MGMSAGKLLTWLAITLFLILAILATWWLLKDNGQWLFAGLGLLEQWVEQAPAKTALVFVLMLAISTALTLPTVTVMTVAGGFLFGTLAGAILSITGALGGAAITVLMVRRMTGEAVRNYASSGRLAGLVRLLERDAFYYLMVFRIIPIAPFFVLNAAAGLIRISLLRFVVATALGLIPILTIFSSVGAGLDTLIEAQDVGLGVFLQPSILGPLLALLGLIVLSAVTRQWMKRRRERLLGPKGS